MIRMRLHSIRTGLLLCFAGAVMFLAGTVRADILNLKNGRSLEGSVEEQNDSEVRIRLYSSILVIHRNLIASVTEEDDGADAFRLYQNARSAGRETIARRYLEEAIASSPENATYRGILAEMEKNDRQKDLDLSLDRIRRLAEVGDYKKALDSCDELLRANAGNEQESRIKRESAAIMAQYAFHLYNHFAETKALEWLERARDLSDPNNPAIHLALARIAEIDENFDAALDEYEAVKEAANQEEPEWKEAEKRLAALPAQPVEPAPPVTAATDIDALVEAVATRYKLTPDFVHRIILLESSRRPDARSEDDARGLMQIRKGAWSDMTARLGLTWKFEDSAYDPARNIEIGCAYFAWLRDEFFPQHKDEIEGVDLEELLLQGYHAGPNRTVYYRGRVPGKRTRQYVARYTQLKLASAKTSGS